MYSLQELNDIHHMEDKNKEGDRYILDTCHFLIHNRTH